MRSAASPRRPGSQRLFDLGHGADPDLVEIVEGPHQPLVGFIGLFLSRVLQNRGENQGVEHIQRVLGHCGLVLLLDRIDQILSDRLPFGGLELFDVRHPADSVLAIRGGV